MMYNLQLLFSCENQSYHEGPQITDMLVHESIQEKS